ncbi:MAG TPA: sigma-70 family RNA polymerase sigma factor [Ktedonobacteraceae bacterium]|nr:sigma-70 family RNA polymerase sigma factor [Ktedonobacteraceae bacterium]
MNRHLPDPADQLASWYTEFRNLIFSDICKRLQQLRYSVQDAEDLTEDVFQRAYSRLRGRPEPIDNPKRWLMKIAENVCNDFERKTGQYITVYTGPDSAGRSGASQILQEWDLEDDSSNQPENIVERYELANEMRKLLQELPTEQQIAVMRHYVNEESFQKISEQFPHRAPSTVGKDARRGIEQLRVRLAHIKL